MNSMNNWVSRILKVAAFGFIFVHAAQARQVRGTITDPSGAFIAGATVSVTSDGHPLATTQSDEQGRFTVAFDESKCANCRVTFTAPGFAAATEAIDLSGTASVSMAIRLSIEVANQTVAVEAKVLPWLQQLDLSEVRESAAMDVGGALTQVPGVNKLRKGGIDNDVVVRGFQNDDVNVSIDGARIYGACPGHMDPPVSHTDFSEVERVDVQEGAFDVTSSGSLGAKVSIVTKKPPLGLHITPSFAVGSYGFYNPSITASYGNNRLRILGGYSYRVAQPYTDGQGKSFLTVTNYNKLGYQQNSFEFNTGWMN